MSELYHICSFHLFEKVAVGRVSLSRLLCSPQYLISSSSVHRSRASSIKPPPPLKPSQTHHIISPRESLMSFDLGIDVAGEMWSHHSTSFRCTAARNGKCEEKCDKPFFYKTFLKKFIQKKCYKTELARKKI